ncbi:DUF5919 domain-containing protein [Kutzneria albida]|nr:DUF5919 domain-containing protein [Kutzneria albida]
MTEVDETSSTVLKALLRHRHLQEHSAFLREYDRVANKIDPGLKGKGPSRATFYRWLSGNIGRLPFPGHCRILETMFNGWTAAQLFEPHGGGIEVTPEPPSRESAQPRPAPVPSAVTFPSNPGTADVTAVFASRSQFMHEMPPHQLFSGAQRIRMVGLSLNLLCQHYPDRELQELLEGGTKVDCLFLDPAGESIKAREAEEGHPAGMLANLTDVNIQTLRRVGKKLSPEADGALSIRTYDECVRFNITILNDSICIVQPYLPDARGVESPTLVAERKSDTTGLYDTFSQVFDSMWDRAKEVSE